METKLTESLGIATPKRWFGLGTEAGKTEIQVAEFSDGSIMINLETPRDGMEPLITSMRLCASTFTLLNEAMFRAAHDPSIWRQIEGG